VGTTLVSSENSGGSLELVGESISRPYPVLEEGGTYTTSIED
jgi:hypothetical protein